MLAGPRCLPKRTSRFGANMAGSSRSGEGSARNPNELVVDAEGRALVAGLHDHHIHLLASAAAKTSLDCSGMSREEFVQALKGNNRFGWLRAVNYHESIAGEPDRRSLDAWLPARPLRLQHSTGQFWYLNSAAVDSLQLNSPALRNSPGIERDSSGQATGRLFRADALLNRLLSAQGNRQLPDLSEMSAQLASYGVTGVTDTSYKNADADYDLLNNKQRRGELLQKVRMMGSAGLSKQSGELIHTGELKIMLDEANLPDLDDLIDTVNRAHSQSRGVAVHCVTRIELAVVLSVFGKTGCYGDRIEHGSIIPQATLSQIAALDLTVVTQPGFIFARGDRYLRDHDDAQYPELYRLKSLQDHDIRLALSSDAPYGPLNPWVNMQCSVDRLTLGNNRVSEMEGLTPEQAVAAYCCPADSPGTSGKIRPGMAADLAVLSAPWRAVHEQLAATQARLTVVNGQIIHQAN